LFSFNSFAISPENLRDHVRRTYFFIAGFPDAATRDSLQPGVHLGGMLGLVNDYLDISDQILIQNSVATCAAIPTTGTLSGTYDGDGTIFNISLVLGTSLKIKPQSFPNEGTSYQKRLEISIDGSKEMTVEFDCSRKAGWFSFKEGGSTRTINMFYDNEDANQMYADFYMVNTGVLNDAERFSTSFRTEPGNFFSFIYIVAFQNNTVGDYRGTRTVAKGNWSTNITSVVFQEVDAKATFSGVAEALGATSTTVIQNTADGDAKQTIGCVRDLVGEVGQTCSEVVIDENASATSLDVAGLWNLNWTASDTGMSSKIFAP